MKYGFGRWSILLVVFVCILSCIDDAPRGPVVLVRSEKLLDRVGSELQTFLRAGNFKIDFSQLKYDVELHKIVYKTTYKGEDITASALVGLPKKIDAAVPMISFQHGTIAAHSQAPTAVPLNSTELILYTALASPGFISVVPDFIGFGESKSILHPYYVEQYTASAIADALVAAAELAAEKGVDFNSKLFLAGYSQGGYATMATHKFIEQEGLPGFDLVASFPASGGYDVKAMQEYFFSLATYDQPFFLGYVAMAYRTTYNWTQPLTDFFQEPYASRMPALFNGANDGNQINAQLTTSIPNLVNSDLLKNIDSDARYKYIVDAFEENSLVAWAPKVKLYLYHGDADVTVPFNNSVISYNKLLANGASQDVVSFTVLPGKDHFTGVVPYIENFLPTMLALKEQ